MKSVKLWIFIAVLLFFVTGVLSGILLERKIFRCCPHEKLFNKRDKIGRHSKQKMLNKMAKDLSLSAKQKEKVKKIFMKYEPQFENIRKEFKGKFSTIHKEVEVEIIKVLNEEQKKKFEKIISEREKIDSSNRFDFKRRCKNRK